MAGRPSSGDDRVTEWHQKDATASPNDFSALNDAAGRPMEQPTPMQTATATSSLPSSPMLRAESFRNNVHPQRSFEHPTTSSDDHMPAPAALHVVPQGGEGLVSPLPDGVSSSHRQEFDSSPLNLDDPSEPQFSPSSPQRGSPAHQHAPPGSSEGSRQFHKRMVLTGGLSALEGDSSCSSDDEHHVSSNATNQETYERIADDAIELGAGRDPPRGAVRVLHTTVNVGGRPHEGADHNAHRLGASMAPQGPVATSIEGNINGLYTFQKRSLRQSRENWKASNGEGNAFTFPKANSSMLRMLNVVMKRHANAHDPAASAAPKGATAIVLPSQVKKVIEAPKPQQAKPKPYTSESLTGVLAPTGRQGGSPSKSARASTPLGGLLDAPPDVVMTCVLPTHSHLSYSRPPSESLYQSFTSPPSTASQLLARNLVGFRPLQSAMGSTHMSGKSISGDLVQPFQASSSIIGSLRPNSVLKLPPIAISTSEDVSLQPEKRHQRGQLKPPLPSSHNDGGKPMRKPVKHHGEPPTSNGGTSNVSDPNSSVGDPQEMFAGGAFTTLVPTGDLTAFPVDDSSWTAHPAHPVLLPMGTGGAVSTVHEGHNIDDTLSLAHDGAEGLRASLAHYRQGALRDVATPTRLQSFGLKPTRAHGLPSSPRVSSKMHALEQTTTDDDGAHGGQPRRHPELLPRRTRRKEMDAVSRVEEVCRWGYDLRSLFLAQLEREGTTAAQFCAKHKRPFDAMIAWIQHGNAKSNDSSSVSVHRSAAAKPRPDMGDQIQSLTRLIAEYVGSTLFRGKNNVAPKFKHEGGDSNSLRQQQPRNLFQPPDAMDASTLLAGEGALDGEARGQLRKVLVTQALGLREFCSLCSLLLGQSIPRDEVKVWLEDPSVSSKKVERAASFFLKYNNTLRSEFMKCLDWNRQEADAMRWYEARFVEQRNERLEIFRQVLESDEGCQGEKTPPAATSTQEDVGVGGINASVSTMELDSLILSHTEALALAVIAKYQQSHQAQNRSETNTSPPLPTTMTNNGEVAKKLRSVLQSTASAMSTSAARVETVEEFSAQHYISHADVCAWLAHSPRYDKSVLSFIWNFVAAHHQQRPQRSRLVELLDNLLASVEATDDELFSAMEAEEEEYRGGALHKLTDHRAKNATPSAEAASDLMDATLRFLDGTTPSLTIPKMTEERRNHRKSTAAVPPITVGLSPSKCKRVPQDQFVLESVISKLCMEDPDDYHRGALHGGGVAAQTTNSTKGRASHWRDLVEVFPRHQELLFEQEAQLMRQLVKRRADPHHRNDFEKLKGRWREEEGKLHKRESTASQYVENDSNSGSFVPLCRQTLHRLGGVDGVAQSPLRIEEREEVHAQMSTAPVAARREGLLRKDWLAAIEQQVRAK